MSTRTGVEVMAVNETVGSTLLVVSKNIGPLEGAVYTGLKFSGASPVAFLASRNAFLDEHGESVPLWLGSDLVPDSVKAGWWASRVRAIGFARAVVMGMDAARHYGDSPLASLLPTLGIYGIRELEVSARRPERQARIERALHEFDARLLGPWAADLARAVIGASPAELAGMPLWTSEATQPLTIDHGSQRVVILAPEEETPPSLHSLETALHDAGTKYVVIRDRELYSYRDLVAGRTFPANMRYRVPSAAHVVLVGESRHWWAVAPALRSYAAHVTIDATHTNTALARALGLTVKKGAALADRVLTLVKSGPKSTEATAVGQHNVDAEEEHAEFSSDTVGSALPAVYDAQFLDAMNSGCQVEAGRRRATENVQDFFYTVAPIEERSNGARFLRIACMARAAREAGAIVVSSNKGILAARHATIRNLLHTGVQPGVLYGESSTSPHPTYQSLERWEALIRDVKAHGGRFAWFIRDLHYLSPDSDAPASPRAHTSMRFRGLEELAIARKYADVLYVPSAAAGEHFRTLAPRVLSDAVLIPLAPGIDTRRAHIPRQGDGLDSRTTFLYAGGVGGVYDLSDYVAALAQVPADAPVLFDFLVREDEADRLYTHMREHGLDDADERIRIMHGSLDSYTPRSNRVVGCIFLGSEYGRNSLPYKTFSYLERGWELLVEEHTPAASFALDAGVGRTAPHNPSDIAQAMATAVNSPLDTAPFATAQRAHSWEKRWALIQHGQGTRY